MMNRRQFALAACAGALGTGAAFAAPYQRAAAQLRKKVKITGVNLSTPA